MQSPWVIVGCGYTGQRLALRLVAQGEHVIATTRQRERQAELVRQGVDARVVDPFGAWEMHDAAVVVDSVPPDRERGPHAEALTQAAARARRIVYLSSTGVYARGDGSWVDEDTPAAPDTARGQARLRDESALLCAAAQRGIAAVSLRIAAIYGPGRGVKARLGLGTYRVVGDGQVWTSRIHVEDLVSVILAAGRAADLVRSFYVVGDDEPTTARAHADAVAAHMHLPSPPSVPASSLPEAVVELSSGNRRIRNARMKAELGVTLRYPSFRDALDE
jgi:nucleoside-diphosphate-sugar epimerase